MSYQGELSKAVDSGDSGGAVLCFAPFGKGLGGQQRTCRRAKGHVGRCSDVPFLDDLFINAPKVATKIIRDAFNTRGSPWGQNRDGKQKFKNRQPRWTLKPGDLRYPHYQTYEICIDVAKALALLVYEMPDAPDCPDAIAEYFESKPRKGHYACPICLLPVTLAQFALAQQSKAALDTDHLDPNREFMHTPDNVAFVHHGCNTAKGELSLEGFQDWLIRLLERRGFRIQKIV